MLTFFRKLLSDRGHPLAWRIDHQGRKRNVFFNDIEALAAAMPSMDRSHQAVYFALATVKEYREARTVDGQYFPAELRKADNLHEFKALWAEIDIKPTDLHHRTLKEALQTLANFLRETGLPAPMIVGSGGGLHLYWPLTAPISVDTWRTWPAKILGAARHLGLRVDPAAINLATQVLRPIGTTHRKDPQNPKTVTLLRDADPVSFEHMTAVMDKFILDNNVIVSVAPSGNAPDPFVELCVRSGLTWTPKHDPRLVAPILRGCAQMRAGMANEAPFTEPTWRGVLSIALLCEKGEQVAHVLSSRDNRYDARATDEKIAYIKESGGHPYTCAAFEAMAPDACRSCPHHGKIKSPIVLGIPQPEEELPVEAPAPVAVPTSRYEMEGVTIPPMAPPTAPTTIRTKAGAYQLDEDGVSMFLKGEPDEPAQKIKLTQQRLYAINHLFRIDDEGNKEFYYTWRIENAQDDYNDCIVGGAVLHKDDSALAQFTKYGLVVEKRANIPRLCNYMRAMINDLKATQAANAMSPTLGWQANGDFVAGLQTVTAGGVVMKAALAQEPRDRATICNMQPTGDFAKWRAAMDVFNHPGQEHAQLAICGAYASPLMVFSAIQGFIVSLHGVTGSGKTAIQRASASVWGEPRKQLFTAPNTSGGDTMLSVIRAIGTGRHLPVNMEEITNMPAEKMSDFVHAMTLGSEKSRLKSTQNGEYARSVGMQWETVMIASSNETIRDKLNSAKYDAVAESMRVFELRHIPLVKGTDVVRDTVRLKDLNSHYGHGGTIYARFLQSNREKLEGWINKRVEWITEKVHATQDERFWVQGMAVWLVGIELSRAAGLHSFDVPNLERYIIAQFLDQRAQVTMVKEHSSTSFSEMVNDLLPRAVILDRNTNSAQGELKSIYPKSGRLAMRVEIHNGVGYLSTSAVRDWALMKNIPHSALLENGVSGGYLAAVDDTAKTARKVLSKGVKGLTGGGQIRCYKFKVPDEELYSIKNHMVANTEENEDEPE